MLGGPGDLQAEADAAPASAPPPGAPQAHLSRGGRWKESPRKLVLSELQDELMSVRLREAQALADGRELRQRVVELETQVSPRTGPPTQHCPGVTR